MEALVSASPSADDGATREDVVKTEIEDNDNDNLTIPQVINRLGMVFFLLIFNLGITIFVFLLTGMMIFSQILFIIFAMFLPISFLLSMIPSYENMAKQAIVRVFNTIMTRAGITLIVTVAFSISSMFYNISTDYPFFMIAFLQIVCFAGIYMKLGDLMSMFSLNAGDSQSMGRRIFRRPYLFMRHRARRMEHRIARAVGKGSMVGAGTGAMAGAVLSSAGNKQSHASTTRKRDNTSFGSRAGSAVGAVLDTKNKVKDKATAVKENIKDMANRIINVDHQLLKDSEIGYYIETPKTKKGERQLPMTERAYQAFKRVLQNRGKAEPIIIGGYSNFLFLNQKGFPKVAGNYESMLRGLVKKYNKTQKDQLPNITPHSFRHTYCTNMANKGMNPNTLQYIMGHANITMTLGYYAHGTFNSAKAELERLALAS